MKTVLITRSSPMSKENADKLAAMLSEREYIANVRKFRNTELYYVVAKQVVEIS